MEFHFYSGEEGGLLGSQEIAAAYSKSADHPVYAVYHNDMTGYIKNTKAATIGLITDYISEELLETVEMAVDAYAGVSWTRTKCGYACSGFQ